NPISLGAESQMTQRGVIVIAHPSNVIRQRRARLVPLSAHVVGHNDVHEWRDFDSSSITSSAFSAFQYFSYAVFEPRAWPVSRQPSFGDLADLAQTLRCERRNIDWEVGSQRLEPQFEAPKLEALAVEIDALAGKQQANDL